MLYSLFLFRGKVPKANREDSKFNREDSKSNKSISLEDVFIASSLQKRKAQKASKKSPKKKLKIGPIESLASSRANKQKGKAIIITKGEVIVGKVRPKRKMKCSYYSRTPAELIKALDSKKEPEDSIFSVLY